MKRLSSSQFAILLVAAGALTLGGLYHLFYLIKDFRLTLEWLFDYGFLSFLSEALWVVLIPINLTLAIALAFFTVKRNSSLVFKAGASLVLIKIVSTIAYTVINFIRNDYRLDWFVWFIRNTLFGWYGFLNHFIITTSNIALIAIMVALAMSFLSAKPSAAPVSEPQIPQQPQPSAPIASSTLSENPTGDLAQLVKMYEAGHLTEAEFKAAKKKLLS